MRTVLPRPTHMSSRSITLSATSLSATVSYLRGHPGGLAGWQDHSGAGAVAGPAHTPALALTRGRHRQRSPAPPLPESGTAPRRSWRCYWTSL